MSDILDLELDDNQSQALKEALESWKEDVYSNLLEEVEKEKDSRLEELEEANLRYREELKEEFADKMVSALSEMKEEIRAEVLSEMVESNPEIQVLESIKEAVAPLMNEEYVENAYFGEIQTLREKVELLEREKELNEGAETLAELLAPYSKPTREIILSVIKEGNSEEVTEQFYEIMESINGLSEDEDEDEDDDEDEYDEDEDDEDEDDEDDEEDEDDEMDEDEETEYDTYISEDEEGEEKEEKKVNLAKENLRRIAGF